PWHSADSWLPSRTLQDHGGTLTTRGADGAQHRVLVAALEVVQRLRDDAGARRSEGVAEGDRTAGHVQAIAIDLTHRLAEAVLLGELLAGEGLQVARDLRGESLVHLHQVDVREGHPGAGERDRRGVGGTLQELAGRIG